MYNKPHTTHAIDRLTVHNSNFLNYKLVFNITPYTSRSTELFIPVYKLYFFGSRLREREREILAWFVSQQQQWNLYLSNVFTVYGKRFFLSCSWIFMMCLLCRIKGTLCLCCFSFSKGKKQKKKMVYLLFRIEI